MVGMRSDGGPWPLSPEKPGNRGRAALQGGAVFLREGTHPLALDVDGAHDLPPRRVQDGDYDLRAGGAEGRQVAGVFPHIVHYDALPRSHGRTAQALGYG